MSGVLPRPWPRRRGALTALAAASVAVSVGMVVPARTEARAVKSPHAARAASEPLRRSAEGTPSGPVPAVTSTPATSADGRFVAFQSTADDLVPGDTNGLQDVFVYDTVARTTVRVSVSSAGREGDGPSGGAVPVDLRPASSTAGVDWERPSVSADGRFVAFSSTARNLVAGRTEGRQVFVRDRDVRATGVLDQPGNVDTFLVSRAAPGDCGQRRCPIGGDGASRAPSLVSVTYDTLAATGFEHRRTLAVAYSSTARNLFRPDPPDQADSAREAEQVYLYRLDRRETTVPMLDGARPSPFAQGELSRISSAEGGDGPGNGSSRSPSLAARLIRPEDGLPTVRLAVAYSSTATDLRHEAARPCEDACDPQVHLWTDDPLRRRHPTVLVTHRWDEPDRSAGGASTEPVVVEGPVAGPDAVRWDVAYTSSAADLAAPEVDTNAQPDVYTSAVVVEHQAAEPDRPERAVVRVQAGVRASVGPAGEQADNPSGHASVAPGGRFVAFASTATTLGAPGLAGPRSFVRDRDPDGSGDLDAGPGATTRLAPLVAEAADQPPSPVGTPALGGSWDGGAFSAVLGTGAAPGAPGQLLVRPWRTTFGPVTELPVEQGGQGKDRPQAAPPPDPVLSATNSIPAGTGNIRVDWVPAPTGEPATSFVISFWSLPRVDDPNGVPVDLVQKVVAAPATSFTWTEVPPAKTMRAAVSAHNAFGGSVAVVAVPDVAPVAALDVRLYPERYAVRSGQPAVWVTEARLPLGAPGALADVVFAAPAGCGAATVEKFKGEEPNQVPDLTPDLLDPGDVWVWRCSTTPTQGTYATAGVSGQIGGVSAAGSDQSSVAVIVGRIRFTKEAKPRILTPLAKGTVTWTLRARNEVFLSEVQSILLPALVAESPLDLEAVTIDDPLCAGSLTPGPANGDRLANGDTWSWTCTTTGLTTRTVNEATVSAYPADDGVESSTADCWDRLPGSVDPPVPWPGCRIDASASAEALVASLVVDKTVDKPIALKGSTVAWNMDVSIPADGAPVELVKPVADDQCPIGSFVGPVKNPPDDGDEVLEAGEVWTWTCASAVTADVTNTVTFEAYPWRELAPECYEAPIIINRQTERARPSAVGDPYPACRVDDSDDAAVDVIAPAVSLAKAPDRPVVVRGSVVTWSIEALLTGDLTPVKDVVVTDPGCGPLSAVVGDDGDGALEAGESWRWTCQSTPVASYLNTATVTAVDVLIATPVTATAQAPVTVIEPGIALTKVVDKPVVVAGTTVRWTMTASIAGDGTPVRDVSLSDPGCDSPLSGPTKASGGAPDPTPDTLDPGDSWVWTCMSTITTTTTNTATATGVDSRVGSPVAATASADVKVVRPGIALTKTVDRPVVVPGTVVTWTVTATLAAELIPLDQVVLTDPRCDSPLAGPVHAGGDGDAVLEPGETWTWTCTTRITVETLNTARVTARDVQAGSTVEDDATARVRVSRPGVRLHKSAYWTGAPGGVLWSVEATVGGDGTALGDVTLADVGCGTPLTGPGRQGGDQDDLLEEGEQWVWLCSSVIDGYGENTATITAVDVAARSTVTDDAKAIVYAPRLALRRPMGQQGAPAFVTGTFFPPGTIVRLQWKPGIRAVTSTTASGFGTIATPKMVFRHDPLGARLLLAVDFQTPVVLSSGDPYVLVLPVEPVAYVVQPLTFQPPQWVPDPADDVPGPPSAIERAIRALRGSFLSLVARG